MLTRGTGPPRGSRTARSRVARRSAVVGDEHTMWSPSRLHRRPSFSSPPQRGRWHVLRSRSTGALAHATPLRYSRLTRRRQHLAPRAPPDAPARTSSTQLSTGAPILLRMRRSRFERLSHYSAGSVATTGVPERARRGASQPIFRPPPNPRAVERKDRRARFRVFRPYAPCRASDLVVRGAARTSRPRSSPAPYRLDSTPQSAEAAPAP